jgi:hypothetical protein
MDLTDYIAELTRPHTHREHYTTRQGGTTFGLDHVTKVPSLLEQLQYAAPIGNGPDSGAGGYESRPAASVHSVGTYLQIDQAAAKWVRMLGEDDDGDATACVRRLNGLAVSLDRCRTPAKQRSARCCAFHELERDVRDWWTWAKIATGWEEPPWKPDNTCPMCGARGTLRVRHVEQIAACAECHESWEPGTIGLLAEHIRAESAGERPRPLAVFCWCAWPRPAVDAWPSLCPNCASPWCHRAGWVKALKGPAAGPEHAFADDLDGRMGA